VLHGLHYAAVIEADVLVWTGSEHRGAGGGEEAGRAQDAL
jgi:hypothetical protein